MFIILFVCHSLNVHAPTNVNYVGDTDGTPTLVYNELPRIPEPWDDNR